MTRESILKRWPASTEETIANLMRCAGGVSSSAKPKPPVRHDPLAAAQGKESDATGISRRIVRISSYRRRLLDFDNLAGGSKYFLDCCKYAQLVPDDDPASITLEVRQVKVKNRELECTVIEILWPTRFHF